jgi:hypothetical protein
MGRKLFAIAMTYCYSLLATARGNLAQEVRRNNVDLRRVLGHVLLLDTLVAGLSKREIMAEECAPSKDHELILKPSGDSDIEHLNSDSDPGSDLASSDSSGE